MGILGRLSRLVKSNVNDLIDSMQDPAKEIDQMIRDMEDSARQAKAEVAQAMAEEKRLTKRVEQLVGEAKTWEEHAVRAVQSSDDALAKEALKRKAEKDADRLESEKLVLEHKTYVEQLVTGLKALETRLQEVKLRQGSLREKARATKGGAATTRTAAFDDFDRMSGKIDSIEAEVGLSDELAGRTPQSAEADRKLREMSEGKSLDDALDALKKKLNP